MVVFKFNHLDCGMETISHVYHYESREDASHNLGISLPNGGNDVVSSHCIDNKCDDDYSQLLFIGVIVPNIIRKFYGDHITRIKD